MRRRGAMTVLAFDTSGSACSAAVLADDGVVLGHRYRAAERGHAEILLPMVEEVMAAAGRGFCELDLLAVTVGPGAFTGIRVGLAAARGLALASRLPLLGLTSLECVAAAVTAEERRGRALVVAIDSRRGDVFFQAFAEDASPLAAPVGASAAELPRLLPEGALVLAGDAASRIAPVLAGAREIRVSTAAALDALRVARLAQARWQQGTAPPLPRPLYLRAPDVTRAAR